MGGMQLAVAAAAAICAGEKVRKGNGWEEMLGFCSFYMPPLVLGRSWTDGLDQTMKTYKFNRGMRGYEAGGARPSPPPPDPTGTGFIPFDSPRVLNCYHPRPLIEEFPVWNRGSGPRCHP
jgi:hypothetical protein